MGGDSHPFLGFTYIPMQIQQKSIAAMLIALVAQCGAMAAYAAYPLAGLNPSERPANAPELTAIPVVDSKQALRGVSAPIPDSLKFLKDQGAWFTPFTKPGMTGPYDIRGWHGRPVSGMEKK